MGKLARLHKLVKVIISHSEGLQDCNPQSFANLTSNSKLDTLIVDFKRGAVVASTATVSKAWEHTFAPGRQLLQLTCLEIDGAFPCTSADIERITCCCPALRKLHIRTHPSKESSTQLSALASLNSLTSLSITGVNDSMAPSLAQLSCLGKLQDLIIGDIFAYPRPEHLQDARLQQLTVLTQLTSLKFSAACLTTELFNKMVAKGFKKEHSASGHFSFMHTKARYASSPDVWAQLKACFE